jgi:hypothetical protein
MIESLSRDRPSTQSAPRRLVIMPAHNEASNLPRVIPDVRRAAAGYDLLIVDDGSRDATAEVAACLGDRVVTCPVTDPTSGFQALNADAMAFLSRDNYPVDYPDADTLLVLYYAGFKTAEVPVTMRERISGVSMHSGLKPFYYIGKMWLSIAMVLLRQGTRMSARRTRREPPTVTGTPIGGEV